jgi:UDP:flavonoid glycosyltransferase YjiC (YdhE family)
VRRVLFVAEAVTWAQVVRLGALARGLDRARWEVHFAAARFDPLLLGDAPFRRWPIASLSAATVASRLARGARLYDLATLARYVAEERRLFDVVQPDVVVSDLRWSTTVSAPAAGVRLATLVDGYWFRPLDHYPIPDHPVVRLLGPDLVARGFSTGLAWMLRRLAHPVNVLRRRHGLAPFADLRDVLAFGDALLFPDDAALVASERPGTFLGPVLWAPEVPLPPWWDDLRRPLVYVTMGSSGPLDVVPAVLEALATLHVDVVLSTAGRFAPPPGARAVPAIRGDVAARRARVVVCSGGASTAWQALAAGTPVVGLPANLDACLAMDCIVAAGAGVALRPTATPAKIRAAIVRAMDDETIRLRASALAASAGRCDPHARFAAVLDALCDGGVRT